ncbi:MAG TPA: tetratricopeptide repeat protein [Anaerolineaceae bacterium]|nr:tetratricopeptide repeat protein [Anaerolineaceae bacterium]HPN52416.1 tetratricopeptide repeat protein [Anaerolineaceae bacterium]
MSGSSHYHKSICVSCGAPILPNQEGTKCPYCGTFQVPEKPPEIPDENPGDFFVRRGFEAYSRGEYNLCISELEKAIPMPLEKYSLMDVFTAIGNAYDHLDHPNLAIPFYEKAIAEDIHAYKAWVGLGIANRRLSRFNEAERCYNEALAIHPNYAELHASLGALYFFQNKNNLAIASLEKAIQLDPSVAVAHANIALAYAQAGRFDEAEAALRTAVSLGYKNYKTIRDRINSIKELGIT